MQSVPSVGIMNQLERSQFIQKKLAQLYPETPIPLKHKDEYTLLIAVLLSAQCTDKRVNQITPNLFSSASTPEEMIQLSPQIIEKIIKPCGLAPKKSKAIYQLSKILIEECKGQVPNNFEDLEKLPGVGHKTASVIMSQAFDFDAFPVDTHIHRLAQRWGLTKGKNVKATELDLKKIFPKNQWNQLHLRIIFYGREFCTARGCDGTKCEICKTCFPKRKEPFLTQKA